MVNKKISNRKIIKKSALHLICFNNLNTFFQLLIDFYFPNEKEEKICKKIFKKFINAKCDNGFTPLMYAVYRGNLLIIKQLLNFEVNFLEVNSEGSSLLHISIIADQVNTMVYLKEKLNLNVNARNKNGSSPLHLACFYGSECCFNVLLSWIEDVNILNDDGNTPMHFLVISGIFI